MIAANPLIPIAIANPFLAVLGISDHCLDLVSLLCIYRRSRALFCSLSLLEYVTSAFFSGIPNATPRGRASRTLARRSLIIDDQIEAERSLIGLPVDLSKDADLGWKRLFCSFE